MAQQWDHVVKYIVHLDIRSRVACFQTKEQSQSKNRKNIFLEDTRHEDAHIKSNQIKTTTNFSQ
jgi:hypothetical protein